LGIGGPDTCLTHCELQTAELHRLRDFFQDMVEEHSKGVVLFEMVLQVYRLYGRQHREQILLERILLLPIFQDCHEQAFERA